MFSGVKKYFYADVTNKNISLCNIFKPFYIVLSLFGLFPYSVQFNNKRGLTIIQKSIYLNSLCAVSYMLFMTSFLALHIRYILDALADTTMTNEVMTQMNYILELIVTWIFCLAAYICAFKYRCIFVKIINDISSMIEPANPNTERILKRLHHQVNVVIMGFLLVIALLQICVNFTRKDSFWKMILVFATFMLPQFIQFTVLSFYYFLILMLVVLLIHIRLQITNISKNKALVLDFGLTADSKILTLQYLEALYVRAFEIKRNINDAFAASMVVTTMQSFHAMVSEAHIIYHGLVVEKDFTLHPLINCSIWIIYQIVKIFILASSDTLLKQEV